MLKIATFNVNSVRARLPNVLSWLKTSAPDVALLQEIKCPDDQFPAFEFEALGYHVAVHGQKSYNGVAILSRPPLSDIRCGLPGDPADAQARYIEAVVDGDVRVACLYLPNGNPAGTEKFTYKLAWMDRLIAHTRHLLASGEPFVLGGDFNVIPSDKEVYNPAAFDGDALTQPQTRARFHALLNLGLTDAVRTFHKEGGLYSFWDYQAGAWAKNHGLLIDFLLLSPSCADRIESSGIDRGPRGEDKASDHTPVWCALR